MKSIVIGSCGEVGSSLIRVLKPVYPQTYGIDLYENEAPSGLSIDIMHVCIRYSDNFLAVVRDYMSEIKPTLVNVCSTVPPGTCEQLGDNVVHSTTRGLHPRLDEGLKTISKFVAGPRAFEVSEYFKKAGVPCETWPMARMSELAHVLNNLSYAVNVVFADEMAKICRHYGLDYYEVVMRYTQANNDGFSNLGHKSKCRMILTPPNGKIGGHCLTQAAGLLPKEIRTPMVEIVSNFNERDT
jgi:UDP-N-acetyl-D-mannosaminuronate dehydrogenase